MNKIYDYVDYNFNLEIIAHLKNKCDYNRLSSDSILIVIWKQYVSQSDDRFDT